MMKKHFFFLLAACGLLLAAPSVMAQTDMTSAIVNPSFEDDWTGWEYDGLARQGNDAFKLKEGNTYVEKWTGTGGQVGNGSLYQTLHGLPAGCFTLTCKAQNIQQDKETVKQTGVTLRANSDKTQVNVAGTYSVQTVVCDGELSIGFVLSNASGNYVCVDDFRLTLEEATADTYTALHQKMQAIVDEAKKTDQQTGTKEQAELDAARAAVEALIAQDVTEGVTEAVQRLQAAIFDYRLSVASADNTVDMTSCIVNPNFEVKGSDGWTNSGMGAQGNDAFSIKKGNVYMEAWTWAGGHIHDCTLSQLVTLPNGRYRITAAAQNVQQDGNKAGQTGAFLFAGDDETEVDKAKVYAVETVVIEGQVLMGFKTRSATGNWVACDNFTATYMGRSEDMLLGALGKRASEAEALTGSYQNSTVLDKLQNAIANAKAQTASTGMEPVAIALREAMEASKSSIAAYAALADAIAQSELIYGDGAGNEATAYRAAIDDAKQTYADLTKTEQELAAAITLLAKADLSYNLANATGDVPEVHTYGFVARGATGALGRCKTTGGDILEEGFCWATHPNPTISDNHTTFNYNINGPMYLIQPLKPATVYYVRGYAMTKGYQVGYGEVRKVITTPMGTCGWWYNYGADPEANERIARALEDCIYYYNNWSGIQGFHISCTYGSGTPTADCGYGGGMRVGPNPSYQRTGTILHESNHGVGIGTSGRWWDTNLHDGVWKGRRANTVLRFIENNNTATMAGDNMHMWPYGINGASEDNGWAMTYIANVLITYAMHEDGLVPPGKAGNTPAYTFECEDGVKYYISSEQTAGAYLYDAGTTLKWNATDQETLKDDDAYAWYVDFTPSKLYYRLRNAKTGKYISHAGGTIKPSAKATPSDTEYFQLMASRNDMTQNSSTGTFTTCSYWVMGGYDAAEPNTMTIGNKGAISTTTFNLSDAASNQRWLFLTADEIGQMNDAAVQACKDNLRKLVNGAKGMMAVPHIEATDNADASLEALVSEAESLIATSTDIQAIDAAYGTMWNGIGAFISNTAVSSAEQPYDINFMMVNPEFTGTNGWTCNPNPTQNEGISEYFQATYDVRQTISSMGAGRYEFRVQAFERPGSYTTAYNDWSKGTNSVKAYIYYKNATNKQNICHIMDGAQTKSLGSNEQKVGGKYYIPDGMSSASRFFAKGLYDNALVFEHEKDGNMLLGLKNTQNVSGDWTAFDNFRLFSHGNPSITPVDAVKAPAAKDDAVYDLAGRKVGTVTRKCIYIAGGKKVMY